MPVEVVAEDLIVEGIGDLSGTGLTNHTYTAADLKTASGFVVANGPGGTFDATWTYNSLLAIDQYLITLRDGILDGNGIPLDGDWTDPPTSYTDPSSSSFPSGDGRSGGDFEFGFTILPDFDRDNLAQFSDFVILSGNFGLTGMPFASGDFDGDGQVQFSDFTALSEAFGLDFQQWPSGGESAMMQGGGIVWTDSQREEALKAYHDWVEAGQDRRALAMGRHLLRKMWDTVEQEDWLRTPKLRISCFWMNSHAVAPRRDRSDGVLSLCRPSGPSTVGTTPNRRFTPPARAVSALRAWKE